MQRLVLPGVELYCGDCLEMPWIEADAVVSDPPYGIAAHCHGARKGGRKMGTDGMAIIGDEKPFDPRPWLGYPKVCLWGANHYANRLPNSSAWLVWDKREGINPNDQADGETAWTNMGGVLRLKSRYWNGGASEGKGRAANPQQSETRVAHGMVHGRRRNCPRVPRCLIPTWAADQPSSPRSAPGGKPSESKKTRNTLNALRNDVRAELAHDLFHGRTSSPPTPDRGRGWNTGLRL